MSEEMDKIAANLKQPSAWIRILFMLGFAIVLYIIIAPVILVLMLAQALFSVITGSSNANLNFLGAALAKYVFQILEFITYNSEDKPFPFSNFPDIDVDATPGAALEEEQLEGRVKKSESKPEQKSDVPPKQERGPKQAHKPAQEPDAGTGSENTNGAKTTRNKSASRKSPVKRSQRSKDTGPTPASSVADE